MASPTSVSSTTASSSSSSRSGSASSATFTTTTNPFTTSGLPTATFTTPPPGGGFGGGSGGNGNGNGGNGNGGNNSFGGNGNSIASSASLYLYTFLATLVLLLSVSAAIVVRSFLLRRRHRRMIEEAIHNGTWIPPTHGGRGGPKVDLSKKPVMWEAYLDLHTQSQQHQFHQPHMIADERDWESMKPVMATYLNEPVAKKSQNGSGNNLSGGTGDEGSADDNQGAAGRGAVHTRFLGALSRRARDVLRTSPSGPSLPLSHPISNGTGNNTRQGSAVNLATPAAGQEVPMSEIQPPEPPRVRIAVLIAMPRPNSAASSSSSSSSSAHIPTNPLLSSDDEEELPHIEMGVAELSVSDSHLSESGVHGTHGEGKGKVRESMASGASV